MNFRFITVLVAAFLMLTDATAADTISPAASPGRYVRAGDSGSLVIHKNASGVLTFAIESTGANCHICSVSGTLRGKLGRADSLEGNGSDSRCRITFDRGVNGIAVESTTADECRAYCGMRAGFDGIYKTPPANCTNQSQQTSRNQFLKLYRARDFKRASEILTNLISQCAAFIDWIEIDSVRNDLALAQFRAGDPAACLKTLSATRAAEFSNEEMLRDAFPPCDFDNYISVANATWYNRSLCEKGRSAR